MKNVFLMSPSVRLFEAAACGTPIISDHWEGLDSLFSPGEEILVARDGHEVLQRVYWANKATAIVSDVAAEADLHPDLWGFVRFSAQAELALQFVANAVTAAVAAARGSTARLLGHLLEICRASGAGAVLTLETDAPLALPGSGKLDAELSLSVGADARVGALAQGLARGDLAEPFLFLLFCSKGAEEIHWECHRI